MKKAVYIFFVFVVGGFGGVFAEHFFSLYFPNSQHASGITIVNPTEEVVISKDTAAEDATDKVKPCLVAVFYIQNNQMLGQRTGVIATSDGLIVTVGDENFMKADKYVVLRNGEYTDADLISHNEENDLVVLKMNISNLPVVSLSNLDDLRLSSPIILTAVESIEGKMGYFINIGVVRSITNGTLKINLDERNESANGAPIINLEGELIGLCVVDNGLERIISVGAVKKALSR